MHNNLTLYDITENISNIMNEDKITDEDKKELMTSLNSMLEKKSNGIIKYIQSNDLLIQDIDKEIQRLQEYKKSIQSKQERFRKYVKECMENNNIVDVKTSLGEIKIANSPISVTITDEEKIPKKYKKTCTTEKVDKKQMIKDFKETGEIIDGVQFNTNEKHIKIK